MAAIGLFGGCHVVLAQTSNHLVYTNAAGDIYLKASEQLVLIHADISLPLLATPADGYLKIITKPEPTTPLFQKF